MLDIDKETVVRNVHHSYDDNFDEGIINKFEDSQEDDDYTVGVSVQKEEDEEPSDSPEPDDFDDEEWDDLEEMDNGL